MNHFYYDQDGCIYFHCGRAGHRMDALKKSDKVSFCVVEQGEKIKGDWAYQVRSVIVFGSIRVIDDMDMIVNITSRLSRKFTEDEAYIQKEICQHAGQTLLLRLLPEHICGKLVTES